MDLLGLFLQELPMIFSGLEANRVRIELDLKLIRMVNEIKIRFDAITACLISFEDRRKCTAEHEVSDRSEIEDRQDEFEYYANEPHGGDDEEGLSSVGDVFAHD